MQIKFGKSLRRLRSAGQRLRLRRSLLWALRGIDPVLFVQIGAHDGQANDHVRPLVQRYGWRGALVEPVPELFERLVHTYAGVVGVSFERAAVAETNGSATFYRVRPDRCGLPWWADQVGSLDREHVVKELKAHADAIIAETVPTLTLSTLLARHGLPRLDLLAVDAEGSDYDILRQVDFSRASPTAILYEHKHLDAEMAEACAALLIGHGYRLRRFDEDTLATHRRNKLRTFEGRLTPHYRPEGSPGPSLRVGQTRRVPRFVTGVAVDGCETPRCGFMRQPGAARAAPL